MAEEIQSLSLQLVEKASEKFANIREVFIQLEIEDEVKPFKVEIYKVFAPISVTQCVAELVEKLDIVKAKDKNGFGNIVMPYMIFMMVKHFTTLELPNEFKMQIKALESLTNTGALLQIFSYFDEKEVDKVQKELAYLMDNFNDNLPEIEELKKKIKAQLVNKDLVD